MSRIRTHGASTKPIYAIWSAMRGRCNNKNLKGYKDYGGRGIKVCERWQEFKNFYADMGECPDGKSLGRVNNDGDYSPENCRWETDIEQLNNTRVNRKITLHGVTKTMTQWSRETGLKVATIWRRLDVGWSVEKSLTPLTKEKKCSMCQGKYFANGFCRFHHQKIYVFLRNA